MQIRLTHSNWVGLLDFTVQLLQAFAPLKICWGAKNNGELGTNNTEVVYEDITDHLENNLNKCQAICIITVI